MCPESIAVVWKEEKQFNLDDQLPSNYSILPLSENVKEPNKISKNST